MEPAHDSCVDGAGVADDDWAHVYDEMVDDGADDGSDGAADGVAGVPESDGCMTVGTWEQSTHFELVDHLAHNDLVWIVTVKMEDLVLVIALERRGCDWWACCCDLESVASACPLCSRHGPALDHLGKSDAVVPHDHRCCFVLRHDHQNYVLRHEH